MSTNGIRSRDLSQCTSALGRALQEIPIDAVGRDCYEPTTVAIALSRGTFLLHFKRMSDVKTCAGGLLFTDDIL